MTQFENQPDFKKEFKELPPEAGQTIRSQNGNEGAYAFGTVIPDRNSVADTATKIRSVYAAITSEDAARRAAALVGTACACGRNTSTNGRKD